MGFLRDLSPSELRALPYLFEFWALDHQLPPEGEWKTWVVLGGRGAGKTRAGAEWVRAEVEGSKPLDKGRSRCVALVGETYDQARDVMVFGESGILACTPPDRMPAWEAGRRRLVWPNGAQAQVFSARDFEAMRGPQFDAAWLDEVGCAAVDKGTNQPNRFLDPKSSESGLPRYSNGQRDDLIQMQYLRAVREHWSDPANNPVSPIYGGPMLDTSRMFVWAWDARPYPYFPASYKTWSDGTNYARGHWLNGRASSRSLAEVIGEICSGSGVPSPNTDEVHGLVRGYVPSGGEARAALQPLLLGYGVDVSEDGDTLRFRSRGARRPEALDAAALAWGEGETLVTRTRMAEAELSGRVRLSYVEADGDYEVRSTEYIFPDEATSTVSQNEVPLVLTNGEANGVVERWLAEARVARDGIAFALPPSVVHDVGDLVRFDSGSGPNIYRVDRVEHAGVRLVEATRVEPDLYRGADQDIEVPSLRPVLVPVPVWAEMMDLPLLGADDSPTAPWIVATAEPWPGPVAVYSSADGNDWRFETEIGQPAVMGVTLNALDRAGPGLWDRGPALRVRLARGALSSMEESAVLAGGNVAIIGSSGYPDREVFQFRDATLVGPDTWDLFFRLRGQRGTDGTVPAEWPAGSTVVFAAFGATQIPDRAGALDVPLLYRVGPVNKTPDHPAFVEISHTATGAGLRTYRPVHLRRRVAAGDHVFNWVRQTRTDGDNWVLSDVPLGEQYEAYAVRIYADGTLRREAVVMSPTWTYTAADRAADDIASPYVFEVAQISDLRGPGLSARIIIDD